MNNKMTLTFTSISENESFARVAVGSFIAKLDPTMDELTEIKTVISEAVTNSIIHGYQNNPNHDITITCEINNNEIEVSIIDYGEGIENIELAKEPLFTTKPELERSGMGFTIMENFMDHIEITSVVGQGTTVKMKKQLIKNQTVCH
ncbi:anti-sigma F factor [Ornithinibacillus sp. 4-3]|uniref:Anti-sigma F factor n=1 Tax=Ornithinibacillus sp. 4-3 TaxID=3231488 RepID=A0AB39HIR6_9BACI